MEKETNLTKLIVFDFVRVRAGLIPLLLLIVNLIVAMGVIFNTHQTRIAIMKKDDAYKERERLDNEWRNLILEENALAEHSRVQRIAVEELEMKRPDADKEVVISFNE